VLGSIASLAATSKGSGSSFTFLLFLVAMGAVFYFLLIRPQQRRQRAQRALIDSVEVGDEVMTVGGMYGTVRAMDDESVTVEVAPNVDIRFAKSAIARKLVYDEYDDDETEDEGPEEGSEEPEEREAGEQS
jgi:preprotein translocase subunit YajC